VTSAPAAEDVKERRMSIRSPHLTWSFPQNAMLAPEPVAQTPRELDLTQRQAEILYWVQEGKSSSDIGGILGLSHRTVEHHLENVCRRFGVRTRIQAMLKARDLGLIPINDGGSSPRALGSPTRI